MTKKVREALERVERELLIRGVGSTTTQFGRFIEDLWTLIYYIKDQKRRKRV